MLYGFLLKSGYQFRCVFTSVFSPTEMVEFLGFFLDLVAMTDSATMRKSPITTTGVMLLQGDPSFHDWAFFLSLAVASDLEVLLAPFLYNSLEFVGNEDLVLHKGVYLLSLLWLLM